MPPAVTAPLAPDYGPRLAQLRESETALGVRLVPRSRQPTDGLILRTVSAPARCTDDVLQALAPVSELIVEAELARTVVTDAGIAAMASWPNLRRLDLTATATTAVSLPAVSAIPR